MRILLPRMHFLLTLSLVVVAVLVLFGSSSSSSSSSSNSSTGGGGGGASDSDINSIRSWGSSKILTWTGIYKPGATDGAWDCKYTLGTRAGK